MGSPLVFYTNPMSRGRIVRWALEEIAAPYETKVVAYGAEMKAPEYLAINPMGKVPAIIHGDRVVTETAAICAYLADAFPAAGLAPPLAERHSYYRWLFFAAGPLEAAVTNRALGFAVAPEQQRMAGYGSMELVLDTLEAVLEKTDYIAGSGFTVADIYFGSQLAWGFEFGTLEPRPVFRPYVDRVTGRDSYHWAKALDDALVPAQ